MAHADADALRPLLPLLRQLRALPDLREMRPGIFYLKGSAFLHFHDEDGVLSADLKRSRGGFERYPLDSPVKQRKLIDDAKRRLKRDDDE